MHIETATEATPNGKKAKPTSQAQIPGTEKGSDQLRRLHEAFCVAKYEAKAAQEVMKEIKPDLVRLMEEENIESLSCEIDYGDELRRAVTTRETKSKLRTTLEDAGTSDDDE